MKKILLAIALAFVFTPQTCFAQRVQGVVFLTEYADTFGFNAFLLPNSVPSSLLIDWKFSRNRNTGKYSLKFPLTGQKLACTNTENKITCPLRTQTFSSLGVCNLTQKHIFKLNRNSATATITQNLLCPQFPFSGKSKYVAIFARR